MQRAAIHGILSVAFGLAAAASSAQVAIKGQVVEGSNREVGIYFVRVEILNGDKVLRTVRTDEGGNFRVSIDEKPPLMNLVARFSKPAYKENPTRVPFAVPFQATIPYALAPVRLIPENASGEYLAKVTESILTTNKGGNNQEILSFYPSVLGLPTSSKAMVFEQVKAKDPGLYATLIKADEANSFAAKWQQELRKKNPYVEVMPDFTFKNPVLVNGMPKKTIIAP